MDKNPEQKSSSPVQKVKRTSPAWKRLFGKKWVYPGIYVLAAALIIAFMWWYQGSRMNVDPNQMGLNEDVAHDVLDGALGEDLTDEAVPAGATVDNMISPVAEGAQVVMAFYDDDSSKEEKEAALVEYGRSFTPHSGIDFAREDGKAFDVLAVLAGTVESVDAHPLNGQEVRIKHDSGLETVYQSLADVTVKEGDPVAQGDVIGEAGRSKVEKASGVHLHFEVDQNGDPVNPEKQLPQKDHPEKNE